MQWTAARGRQSVGYVLQVINAVSRKGLGKKRWKARLCDGKLGMTEGHERVEGQRSEGKDDGGGQVRVAR